MSTGADCFFYEKNLDEWYYKLQAWPYGENPVYDTYGPFKTAKIATAHLNRNHANPGGWGMKKHPAHVCEFKLETETSWSFDPIEVCQKCDMPKREKKHATG